MIKQKQIIAMLLILCTAVLFGASGMHAAEADNSPAGNLTSTQQSRQPSPQLLLLK